jgi:DNA-binding GntR family transcriptional regulator
LRPTPARERGRDTAPSAALATLALLRSNPLASAVQQEIEGAILRAELAPGAKLNEAALAGQMGARQLPLREAVEIYEVRAALDGLIGRLAAQRIEAAALQRLRELVKRMHAAGRTRDVDAYFPLNIEFHELLARAAGNAALLHDYQRVVNQLNLFRRATLAHDAEHIAVSTRDHEAIVDAVAKGDAEQAERLLFEHAIDSRERLHAALRTGEPRAEPA